MPQDSVSNILGCRQPSELWQIQGVTAVLIAATITIIVAGASPSAAATGFSTDLPGDAYCSFELTAPQLTELPGGAKAVTATVTPSGCSGDHVWPMSATVCVATPDGPGRCEPVPGYQTARVFVTTNRYTGTFTATGRGCWAITTTGGVHCEPLPPVSATF